MSELHHYALRIDGNLFREQRKLLLKVLDAIRRGEPYVARLPREPALLEGILSMLDAVAGTAKLMSATFNNCMNEKNEIAMKTTESGSFHALPPRRMPCDCSRSQTTVESTTEATSSHACVIGGRRCVPPVA